MQAPRPTCGPLIFTVKWLRLSTGTGLPNLSRGLMEKLACAPQFQTKAQGAAIVFSNEPCVQCLLGAENHAALTSTPRSSHHRHPNPSPHRPNLCQAARTPPGAHPLAAHGLRHALAGDGRREPGGEAKVGRISVSICSWLSAMRTSSPFQVLFEG